MRIFAISDLHVDYEENRSWVQGISESAHQQDILILAGDISDNLELLDMTLSQLREKFRKLLFIPGNHELWVRGAKENCSLQKFSQVNALCKALDIETGLLRMDGVAFVPLLGWYDYSFAAPDPALLRAWRDNSVCRWPSELDSVAAVNEYFLALNAPLLQTQDELVISYSHFLPRIDLMPARIPEHKRNVYPVLGSTGLGRQVLTLRPAIHVYGHSHVNRSVSLDGIRYVNNAYGYPNEARIARKQLLCIHDTAMDPEIATVAKQPAG